ncbi:MAG: exo-alpha-sialidase [Flavobacteriales bacterium]|nr:exo-alpha-sialidase [Flavobacteriales bacterium]
MAVFLLTFFLSQANAQEFTEVFSKKTDGYRNYRIPSLMCSKNGVLLAFAEGRASLLDNSENDIVLKRSSDNGKTWEALSIVAEDGRNALNNPEAVVRSDGRIILMYQRYADGYGEKSAMPGLDGNRICKTFVTYSDDDGVSWSKPEDITQQVKRPEATSVASGPGIGMELQKGEHAGRLVMPFNQGPWEKWFVYSVYSDDGGQTWQKGEIAPYKKKVRGWANEVQMVELSDGRLMLNARSETGNRKRKIAYSDDGGQTWSEVEDDKELLEPQCQGSLIRYDEKTILFCNPRHRTRRMRGTIYASLDDGITWPYRKIIYKDGFAYSCMAILPDGSIGILFEKDGYDSISFITLTNNEILDSKTK